MRDRALFQSQAKSGHKYMDLWLHISVVSFKSGDDLEAVK